MDDRRRAPDRKVTAEVGFEVEEMQGVDGNREVKNVGAGVNLPLATSSDVRWFAHLDIVTMFANIGGSRGTHG